MLASGKPKLVSVGGSLARVDCKVYIGELHPDDGWELLEVELLDDEEGLVLQ